jgi:hypothetical protein
MELAKISHSYQSAHDETLFHGILKFETASADPVVAHDQKTREVGNRATAQSSPVTCELRRSDPLTERHRSGRREIAG